MDLSQEQMDTSVLNDSTVQHNSTSLSTTYQSDTTLSSATSQRPVAKNQIRVPANYFDLDDILAMNERVPCQVEQDLFKMGYLDQSTDDEHLPKGTKLELPIWFAKEFHSEQVKVLKIDAPKGDFRFSLSVILSNRTTTHLFPSPTTHRLQRYLPANL